MIIPSSKYPANTAVDLVNYPQGKARNVTASGDGTGTPLDKDWVNDWFGFQQALVALAGITPNGTPDTAVSSQALQAIQAIMQVRTLAAYQITTGALHSSGGVFGLSLLYQFGGYSMTSGAITVPAAGKYLVKFQGNFDASSAANPTYIAAGFRVNAVDTTCGGTAWRYSTNPSDIVTLAAETLLTITTPGTQAITLAALSTNVECSAATLGTLIVERVG